MLKKRSNEQRHESSEVEAMQQTDKSEISLRRAKVEANNSKTREGRQAIFFAKSPRL